VSKKAHKLDCNNTYCPVTPQSNLNWSRHKQKITVVAMHIHTRSYTKNRYVPCVTESAFHSFYETSTNPRLLPVVLCAFATHLPHKKAMISFTCTICQLTSFIRHLPFRPHRVDRICSRWHRMGTILGSIDSSSIVLQDAWCLSIQKTKRWRLMTFG
jgi:hypothetical protein